LNDTTLEANIIPSLANSLTSIGKFCDNNCIGIFTKHKAHILHGESSKKWLQNMPTEDIILNGERDDDDKLWNTSLTTSNVQSCNALKASSTLV